MKKALKKTLSIILTIIMVATMAPFAFAAEEYVSVAVEGDDYECNHTFDSATGNCGECGFYMSPEAAITVNDTTTYWLTLNEAVWEAGQAENCTLTLLEDIISTEVQYIQLGKFTLDLNGKTILCENGAVFFTFSSVDLTIKDSGENGTIQSTKNGYPAIENNGVLTVESAIIKGDDGIYNNATLFFENGTIETGSYSAITNSGTAHVYNGKFECDGEGLYNYTDATLYVYGGEISGSSGILNMGTAYISGGEFRGKSYTAINILGSSVTEITGGSFTGKDHETGSITGTPYGELTVCYLEGAVPVLKGGEFPNGLAIYGTTVNALLADGYFFCDENGKIVDVADDATAISGYVKVAERKTEISKVDYIPSTDTHNTFTVTVNGRPAMVQFIEEDGGTRTYDRNNKNVTITSYDADGNAVGSLDRTAAYEVWSIYTNLIGPDVKMRAKYMEGKDYKWEKNTYNFTLEFAEPVLDTEIYESYLEPVTKKGPAKIVLVTGADVQGVRFKMPNGTTTTYYADSANVREDGKLEFTGKVWMNESGENRIEIYIRSQNTWTYYGNFKHTVE